MNTPESSVLKYWKTRTSFVESRSLESSVNFQTENLLFVTFEDSVN